ncbi:MAG: glycosyltransferase [Lachnospiraceae bacterium]|jgi:rhamnopyranosyl-N-acetylglucosaminyl-diphospho-decaprenol beta-1,3/1,4-galactofuranosyltransferase|nr:glycosyltransferase [Lachnospiraceae bacterium]
MCRIGVVIVTYNRKEKLKRALQSYEEQEYKPQFILVIDNCSSDGTAEFLSDWARNTSVIDKQVRHLRKNSGGSGGFFEGMRIAKEMSADWIWVADDDAYLDKACLRIFADFLKKNDCKRIAALCAAVFANGEIDTWHRRKIEKKYGLLVTEKQIGKQEYRKDFFELDLLSYVGSLIRCEALKRAGLPEKDFYIAYDDSEHSMRIRREGKILCLPEARVIHDTDHTKESRVTWKTYYNLRNKLYSYRLYFGVLPFLCYAFYYRVKNHKNETLNKMTQAAIRDAGTGTLGLSETYGPEWKDRAG